MTPDSIMPDPIMAGLRRTVTAGERLRMHLLSVQRRADPSERGGASVEMAMFYGQAFAQVRWELSTADWVSPPDAAGHGGASTVRQEAILGMAMHRIWMLSETPLGGPGQLAGMSLHWEKIADLVLGE